MEPIRQFFADNPKYAGLLFIGFGVLMILAAIFNWEWVFRGRSFNTQKLEGISNMYGRGCARLVAGASGVAVVVAGIVWFWIA